MWKDFFNFNKRERFTIVALTFLIFTVQVLIWTKEYWVRFLPEKLEQKYMQKKELEAFRDSVSAQKPSYASHQRFNKQKPNSEPLKLVPFNPNTADSLTLTGLGLRSYVVKNILNYRRKGGSFRKPTDFSRIYGMDPAVFSKLEPLIQLEAQNGTDATAISGAGTVVGVKGERHLQSSPTDPSTSKVAIATTEHPIVEGEKSSGQAALQSTELPGSLHPTFELNTADTALLQQLKGVGSFSANRIDRYRKQLGGFYSLSQLSEIKGLYPETLARLQSMLKIDPLRISTLNVNKVSLEKLRAHPYLSFYQAKVIVELRKAKGSLHSLDELSKFKEFKPEDLERLKWYLSF